MQLEPRQSLILGLLVEAYIDSAQPIASATLLQIRPELNLSSATVRHVLVELEAAGFVAQPHTSAGRLPTERGLRHYVDSLTRRRIRPKDRSRLRQAGARLSTPTSLTQWGRALSGISGLIAVVAVPRPLTTPLRELGLVRCGPRRLLAVLVAAQGPAQQQLVELDEELGGDDLQRVQNVLNHHLAGRSLGEMGEIIAAELAHAQASRSRWEARALAIGGQLVPESDVELAVEGAWKLLDQPEFADVGRLRAVLKTLEERETLLALVAHLLDRMGAQVVLGSEHRLAAVPDLACVGCTWEGRGGERSAVGLLGPARMDYARLLPLVQYASALFGPVWAAA